MKKKTKVMRQIDIPKIKNYISTFQNTIDPLSADKAVEEFLNNYKDWQEIQGKWVGEEGNQLYSDVLYTFAANLFFSNHLSANMVELLEKELSSYERKVQYYYGYKYALYYNLVLCLHKTKLAPNDKLKELLKIALYYAIAEANHTAYTVECYAYRNAESPYLLKSFQDEKLSMSAPSTFNDPFDCPILELLNQYGDDISRLIREAYLECLKITCFVNNTKVRPSYDEDDNPIWVSKHDNDPEEYLNELMWAHYAKNHTGVCIKYHFNNNITSFADVTRKQIAYFRDIEYSSDMDNYRKNRVINVDAFFEKGKVWEYENELRLISFDPNGSGEYASIDAKDSIAAIYFGLKCSKEKRAEIIAILKDRKWVNEKRVWDENKKSIITNKEEHPVEFFQMEVDEMHFGKLKAVKLSS